MPEHERSGKPDRRRRSHPDLNRGMMVLQTSCSGPDVQQVDNSSDALAQPSEPTETTPNRDWTQDRSNGCKRCGAATDGTWLPFCTEVCAARAKLEVRNPRVPVKHRSVRRHGHHKGGKPSPTYYSWQSMISRCTNPKAKGHDRYGGRGIRVCERWLIFDNFLADMGERPSGTSLDRVDVNGNYEPSNCRWATSKQQGSNRRSTVLDASMVKQIRHLVVTLKNPAAHVAAAFDLHPTHVRDICKGRRW